MELDQARFGYKSLLISHIVHAGGDDRPGYALASALDRQALQNPAIYISND